MFYLLTSASHNCCHSHLNTWSQILPALRHCAVPFLSLIWSRSAALWGVGGGVKSSSLLLLWWSALVALCVSSACSRSLDLLYSLSDLSSDHITLLMCSFGMLNIISPHSHHQVCPVSVTLCHHAKMEVRYEASLCITLRRCSRSYMMLRGKNNWNCDSVAHEICFFTHDCVFSWNEDDVSHKMTPTTKTIQLLQRTPSFWKFLKPRDPELIWKDVI